MEGESKDSENRLGTPCPMTKGASHLLPPWAKSLSARLLLLTVGFVMLAEVLIYAPSIGRFRLAYLEERLAAAHLAILALETTPDQMIDRHAPKEITQLRVAPASLRIVRDFLTEREITYREVGALVVDPWPYRTCP